jgi:hypothetical protein
MFSMEQKNKIAAAIEKVLLDLNHPEMPKEKPLFLLHVDGSEPWSWDDIRPNWLHKEMIKDQSAELTMHKTH